jgi:hypothetical protein
MKQQVIRSIAAVMIFVILGACTTRTIYFTPGKSKKVEKQTSIEVETVDGDIIKVFDPKLIDGKLVGRRINGDPVEIDTSSIRTISAEVRRLHEGAILLLGGLTALVVIALIAANEMSFVSSESYESCPFIYTYDGSCYILEAEPYGGAVCRGLARTEWIPLEWLTEVDCEYRLLVSNELTETEYIDEISLIAIDHAPGIRIIPDASGRLHTVKDLLPPLSAFSKSGRSLLPELHSRDFSFWENGFKDLETNGTSLREEIILTFPKPEEAREAKLIADAWTTLEGSAIAKDFLEIRGTESAAFLEEVDDRGPAFFKLMQWHNREELYLIHLEVDTPSGWEKRSVIYGGGPFVQKEKCYRFDISDIPGDTLRVRIRPTAGFWRLNSFAVDYSKDQPFQLHALKPFKARTWDGRMVLPPFLRTDGRFHIMPQNSSPVELKFASPFIQPGLERTIILKASGWYDPHFDTTGEPQFETANRILNEPGYAVRWAIEHWRSQGGSHAR